MKPWKIWLGLAIVFLSGTAIGVVGTVTYIHSHIRSMVKEGPAAFNRMVVLHLERELDLTEEQEAVVYDIVTQMHRDLFNFRVHHHQEIGTIIEDGIDRMKKHLDAEQREKMDAVYQEIKSSLATHFEAHSEGDHQEDPHEMEPDK